MKLREAKQLSQGHPALWTQAIWCNVHIIKSVWAASLLFIEFCFAFHVHSVPHVCFPGQTVNFKGRNYVVLWHMRRAETWILTISGMILGIICICIWVIFLFVCLALLLEWTSRSGSELHISVSSASNINVEENISHLFINSLTDSFNKIY